MCHQVRTISMGRGWHASSPRDEVTALSARPSDSVRVLQPSLGAFFACARAALAPRTHARRVDCFLALSRGPLLLSPRERARGVLAGRQGPTATKGHRYREVQTAHPWHAGVVVCHNRVTERPIRLPLEQDTRTSGFCLSAKK